METEVAGTGAAVELEHTTDDAGDPSIGADPLENMSISYAAALLLSHLAR